MNKINKRAAYITGVDSEVTIKKKIAYDIGTLPQYITFDGVGQRGAAAEARSGSGSGSGSGAGAVEGDYIIYENIVDIARKEQYRSAIQYPDFYNDTIKRFPLNAMGEFEGMVICE